MTLEVGFPVMDADGDIFFIMQSRMIGSECKFEVGYYDGHTVRSTGWATADELSPPDGKAWRKWLFG